MTVAPVPMFPERGDQMFERTLGPNVANLKGPLRFEEGVATDTDVPRDFAQGAYIDTAPYPGTMNQVNPQVFYKPAAQTMQERAHVGAASWIEAPTVLREFVQGSVAGDAMPYFEYEYNTGGHMNRPNPTVVWD